MNHKAWRKENDLNRLGLKLAEETGEVATILSDAHDAPMRKREILHLIEEAEHAAFIATQITKRAKALLKKKGGR